MTTDASPERGYYTPVQKRLVAFFRFENVKPMSVFTRGLRERILIMTHQSMLRVNMLLNVLVITDRCVNNYLLFSYISFVRLEAYNNMILYSVSHIHYPCLSRVYVPECIK